MNMCLIQQKDGIRSLNQKCMYGSSRRKRREEYQSMVNDNIAEAERKYLDVNEHWQEIKNTMMEQHRSHVDCQQAQAGIMKHGGRMRKLLKQ